MRPSTSRGSSSTGPSGSPASTSSRTTSRVPLATATCSGVRPLRSAEFTAPCVAFTNARARAAGSPDCASRCRAPTYAGLASARGASLPGSSASSTASRRPTTLPRPRAPAGDAGGDGRPTATRRPRAFWMPPGGLRADSVALAVRGLRLPGDRGVSFASETPFGVPGVWAASRAARAVVAKVAARLALLLLASPVPPSGLVPLLVRRWPPHAGSLSGASPSSEAPPSPRDLKSVATFPWAVTMAVRQERPEASRRTRRSKGKACVKWRR
mmetsp:Transcript_55508/g.178085  ORF Transcript_55508/g.178085 Transcript_55508/m.178085 type:complete len:270 (-) Transcript_55508:426-1235(-)